jgi:hypothetical protein
MSLKRVNYNEVSEEIKSSNPELWTCIEERAAIMKEGSGEEPTFFVAEYSYGESIIDSHGFEPPADSDIRVKQKLNASISSNKKIPLILILTNSSEVYVETQPSVIKSLALLTKGDLIGTYESIGFMQKNSGFQPLTFEPGWKAIAGSRSVFLPILFRSRSVQDRLINIFGNNNFFELKELKNYGILNGEGFRNELKKDAFPIIKAISGIPEIKCDWKMKVIVFPDEWILDDLNIFSSFHKYIYDTAWNQASFSIYLEAISSQLSLIARHKS